MTLWGKLPGGMNGFPFACVLLSIGETMGFAHCDQRKFGVRVSQ